MASAKFANRTVNQSQSATARMNQVGSFPCFDHRLKKQYGRQNAADPYHEHDRILGLMAGIELADGGLQCLSDNWGIEQRLRSFMRCDSLS